MRRDPRDVIVPFFVRISEAQYLQGFLQAVDDFIGMCLMGIYANIFLIQRTYMYIWH